MQGDDPLVQVTKNGVAYAQESADGKYLYYQKGPARNLAPQIWRMSIAGGKEESVVESETWFWCVAKDGIYFIENDPVPVIKRFRFETRHIETIAKLKAPAWGGPGLSLSPNEDVAYYTEVDSAGADIMLLRNFHLR
jgi:hypothetical protein